MPSLVSNILSLPNDSSRKTIAVALALCLVCSVVVSTAAVVLKPAQVRNAELARKAEILKVAGLYDPSVDVEQAFGGITVRIVDLATGEFVDDVDAASFDQRKAAATPGESVVVPKDQDIAGIGRRAKLAPVYLVEDGGEVKKIILPVHGYGLWSTMYGFVALAGDANTVEGLTFYEQAETAGLGAEVANPNWQAKWVGKQVYGDDGQVRLHVVKGSVDPGSANAEFQVDGIAGATLTANGVTYLIQYWLGDQAFGPFLKTMSAGEASA